MSIRLIDASKFFIKYFVSLTLIIGLLGGCYWEFYVKPKVDERIRPLIVGIFEIQATLNKIVPAETRKEVEREVEQFDKLLQK